MVKVLVTGANGFIGQRLVSTLLQERHEVWALLRREGSTLFPQPRENLHYVWGEMQHPNSLMGLPSGIEAAYYLMHSMGDATGNFIEREKQVAENFVSVVRKTSVKQVIYLGGIIDEPKSEHLKSLLKVEEILKNSFAFLTILRASVIVGSGSASFEIIRDLVEKLPIMVVPRWVNNLCQPIAIRDVLFYLTGVLLNSNCYNRTFDIGGPDILSFKEMLLEYAKFRGLRRTIVTVPVLTPRLSSYWLYFVSSVRFSLAYYLVESMKSNTFCRDLSIHQILPHFCLNYQEALKSAFLKVSQNATTSSWVDEWEISHQDPSRGVFIEVPSFGVKRYVQKVPLTGSVEEVVARIWSLGKEGGDWTWRLQKWIGHLFRAGNKNEVRQVQEDLQVDDKIDFWRVLKVDKKGKHLILTAEMKLPGEAWIEFKIDDLGAKPTLIQTATFRPRGVWGRIFWVLALPFHCFFLKRLAKNIAKGIKIQAVPSFLYKIVSPEEWEHSRHLDTLQLGEFDQAFIHLATQQQVGKIVQKFWGNRSHVILKLDPSKLKGKLILEANQGGTNKYYHLYEGSIPLEAVDDVVTVHQSAIKDKK